MYITTGIINIFSLFLIYFGKEEIKRDKINDRNIWMDLLKILSAYAITLLHISDSKFYGQYGSNGFMNGLVLNVVVRFAVPCFLLITGAITMKKKYSVSASWKRVKKYGMLLMVVSVIYLVAKCILWQGFEGNLLYMYVRALLSNNLSGHLWYLYQLIWIWMMLPIVQIVYATSTFNQRMYFVLITVWVPSILDYIGRVTGNNPVDFVPVYSITVQIEYLGILVMGDLLNDKLKSCSGIKTKVVSIFAVVFSLLFFILSVVYVCYLRKDASDELFFELRLPALLYGCCVFVMFGILLHGCENRFRKISRIIVMISDSLLYVYAGHCLLQWIWQVEQNTIIGLVMRAAWQFLTCVVISCAGKIARKKLCNMFI